MKRKLDDMSGMGGSYMHAEELNDIDHKGGINRSSEGHQVIGAAGMTQIDDPNDGMFNLAPLNDPIHRRFGGNQLEMSQNYSEREPKFCFCVPLAKGVCCGFISLKIALFIIAAIDITIGGAALGIGISAFFKL